MTKVVFESTATQHLASKHILLNNKKKEKTNKKKQKNRNSANHDHNITKYKNGIIHKFDIDNKTHTLLIT